MLSESCRPALKLTNHTAREKDSEGVPELETRGEGRRKKSKRVVRVVEEVKGRAGDQNESDNRAGTLQDRCKEK